MKYGSIVSQFQTSFGSFRVKILSPMDIGDMTSDAFIGELQSYAPFVFIRFSLMLNPWNRDRFFVHCVRPLLSK